MTSHDMEVVERPKSPGRDERFSIFKTPDFVTRVHAFVIRLLLSEQIFGVFFDDNVWASALVSYEPTKRGLAVCVHC